MESHALVMLAALALAAAGRSEAAAVDDRLTLSQIVKRVDRPAGFPRASAVCFSSRFKHPANAKDPHDTFQAAAAFHATGFYWINGPSQEWFREIKRRGYPFQGWLSTILPDTLFGNTRQKGRIVDQQGDLVTGPWMLAWKAWWGCMNSPEYRKVYLDHVKMYLDAGADALQMDDPGENDTAVRWGGCYCAHCREKAARLGQSPPDIQRRSTEEFYHWIRKEIDAYAGRHVPFSCNSHPGDRCFYDVFDYGLEELPERHAAAHLLYRAVRDAEQRGKAQMFTFVSTEPALTRATIALAYACGTQIVVPWDVYIGTGKPRYFGAAEEFADLYGFARAAAAYLDGYEDAATVMPERADDRYQRLPVAVQGGSDKLNLLVRAQPGQPNAAVVIHCVDTSAGPRPFRLRIDPARFFGDRPVTIDLLTPARYDRALHDRAEKTRDYSSLAVTRRLAAGYVAECDVPAPAPWALLVIAPAPPVAKGIWPPSIVADETSSYTTELRLTIHSATPGTQVRYTLNGVEPDCSSPVCRGPLAITANTTVKAQAYTADSASAVTTLDCRRTNATRRPTLPSALAGARLWLAVDDLAAAHRAGQPIDRWPARIGPAPVAEKVKLYDGRMATPPVLAENVFGRMPGVRFASGSDLLAIRDFANRHLGRGFTVLVVSRSEDPQFGPCGNALNGNGGVPRLYLMGGGFTYNASSIAAGMEPGPPAILAYTHDGLQTVATRRNGREQATRSGPEYAAVGRFGGGHFAVPFWCGNTYHAGDVAEIIAFDRQLTTDELAGVEQYLAQKYGLRTVKMWK